MANLKRAFRAKPEHHLMILEACEQNPTMLTMEFKEANSRVKFNEEWKCLTVKLNSLGFGEKSVEKWQRVLKDWLQKIKAKYGKIKDDHITTGGGPGSRLQLTEIENRLLSVKGFVSVEGDGKTKEFGFAPSDEEVVENGDSEVHPAFIPLAKEKGEKESVDEEAHPSVSGKKEKKQRAAPKDKTIEFKEMHAETMGVLNKINENFNRLNSNVERLCNVIEELLL